VYRFLSKSFKFLGIEVSPWGTSLNLDFEDALKQESEDYGESEIGDDPVDLPAKEVHLLSRILDFYCIDRHLSRYGGFARI
jgi:hypothetical protein